MTWKRRFKRLPMLAKAEVRIGENSSLNPSHVANVSRAGIGLYINKVLPVDGDVTIILHFTDHDGNEFTEKIHGKVAWCQKAFAAGITLNPLNKKEHHHLASFLEVLENSSE
jgi:PilZ domain